MIAKVLPIGVNDAAAEFFIDFIADQALVD